MTISNEADQQLAEFTGLPTAFCDWCGKEAGSFYVDEGQITCLKCKEKLK